MAKSELDFKWSNTEPNHALARAGFAIFRPAIAPHLLEEIGLLFGAGKAGERCLLDHPAVCETARTLLRQLVAAGILPEESCAIQAIAFDKTPEMNWKVSWHQDLLFPVAAKPESPEYQLHIVKEGVDFARPSREILDTLLAARLHLDDCTESNGPLRILQGTHRLGILAASEHVKLREEYSEVVCTARRGEVLLMRPLLLHASSKADDAAHRRVLHLVYCSHAAVPAAWWREIR